MNQPFQTRKSDCAGSLAGFGGVSILYQEWNNCESIASYPGQDRLGTSKERLPQMTSLTLWRQKGWCETLSVFFHLEQPYIQSLSTYHP